MIFVTISGAREAKSEMNEKFTDAISRKSIIATAITTIRGAISETRAKTRVHLMREIPTTFMRLRLTTTKRVSLVEIEQRMKELE